MGSIPLDMFMAAPLVVGTDGSGHALRAVRWAAAEAAARGTALHIVHAVGFGRGGPYLSEGDRRRIVTFGNTVLAEAAAHARRAAPGVAVTTTLCENRTTPCLLGEAAPDATVVVGSRGRGGSAPRLIGPDSLDLAAHASLPVVVVPGEERERAGVVLAAVRDGRDAEALWLAARLAVRDGAALGVVSAWVPLGNAGGTAAGCVGADRPAEGRARVVARITEPVRTEFPGLPVTERVVRAGSVPDTLVRATEEADVIVMGARRRSHRVGSSPGHVAHAVLHRTHCPVLLAPRGVPPLKGAHP
ncbi:universal stress protein [Streptomyces sp. NPDC052042]|uniref:universal stress protein n=1 Tax=Streptomyces sp. NPDC052042 TaxID=3365683 RepID=UPI0037CFC322